MVLSLAWWILQSLLIFKKIFYWLRLFSQDGHKLASIFLAFSWTKTAAFASVHEDEGEKTQSISGHLDLALGQ